ncbi:hypothetical protein [Nitrospira sp. Nam80]
MSHFHVQLLCYAIVWCSVQIITASAQEPILPHGDPRAQSSEADRAHREDIRDRHLKQQGQGSNYRIEGEQQSSAGATGSASRDTGGHSRQDTGLSDPTVNPGQAAGMKAVQGRIVESDAGRHVVRQSNGKEISLVIDAQTTGDTDLHPGDVINGLITPQGRATAIRKEAQPEQAQ